MNIEKYLYGDVHPATRFAQQIGCLLGRAEHQRRRNTQWQRVRGNWFPEEIDNQPELEAALSLHRDRWDDTFGTEACQACDL